MDRPGGTVREIPELVGAGPAIERWSVMQPQQLSLRDLEARRAELRAQGRTPDMIPLQEAIVEASVGTPNEHGAHNYLSTLYVWVGRYAEAEAHARRALDIFGTREPFDAERVACYEHVLALAIAAQGRYAEAAPVAESAVRHYRASHDPPDDFHRGVMAQASEIGRRARLGSTEPEPAPVEGHRDLSVLFRRPDAS